MLLVPCDSCGIMVCNASSRSSSNNYNAHAEDQFDSGGKTRKKFRKRCFQIFIVIFAIVVVLCVAAAVAVILTQKPVDFEDIGAFTYGESVPNGSLPFRSTHRRFPNDSGRNTMDDFINGPQPISEYFAKWLQNDTLIMKGPESYVKVNTNKVHSILSEQEVFIRGDQLDGKDGSSLAKFNADSKYVTIAKSINQVYRHSSKALYEVAEIQNGILKNRIPVGPLSTGNEPVQLLEWNPAPGAVDFVFVYENNIYYQANPMDRASATQITWNGAQFRYHGISDWLYEEEIFSSSKALWWSISGNYLAYAMFDDRNVTKIQVPHYNPHLLYPTYHQIPYPKAGAPNQPAVFLWIWNKMMNSTQMILPPSDLFGKDADPFGSYYVFSTDWIMLEKNGEKVEYLIVVWANRNQNFVILSVCQYGLKCKTHLRLQFTVREMNMWAEPQDFKIKFFSKSGFFIILPREHSDGNVYNHVAHIAVTIEGKYYPVSGYHGGAYDVNEIVGYDKERDEIFFESRGGTLGEMHLFRVPHASESDGVAPQCISCLIGECKWAKANFAPSGQQFLLFCSAPYRNSDIYLKKTKNILENYIIKDNTSTFNPSYEIPQIKHDTVMMSSNLEAHVKLMLPPKFNPKFSYPVLLHLYAGPNSALVNYQNPSSMLTYFASSRQYVVINIDGRGSSHRGWRMRQPLYKKLGGPEIDDQIEVIKSLLKNHSFLDPERVASFGWSYGGFASAHIAARDAGATLKCAVAVAPVTDFRFYDSAYTERYMLQPSENAQGYDAGSLLNKTLVDNIKHVKFLLAHGEADDNVHYQNSALLSKALQEANVHFTQLVYANQDHSISQTFMHLLSEIDRFLYEDCFKLSYY